MIFDDTTLVYCMVGIIFLVSTIFIPAILYFNIIPYLNEKNSIRRQELKIKEYEMYSKVDINEVSNIVDNYFQKYINRYITYKFIAKKKIYVKQDEIELMVRDITKVISIQISELYVYYIKFLQNINNEEDLIKFIHSKVSELTIESVSSFNNSNLGE